MDWFRANSISITIAVITLVSTYAIYGYRIGQLEAQVKETQQTVNTNDQVQVQIQIALGKLQTDTEYLKKQMDRLIGPLPTKPENN